MGVDAGDVDNDGDEDLFVTNLTGEGNDLYVNDGSGLFEEQSARSGLGAASRGYTGFGTAWFDVDNDGWLDTLTVNGAVQTIEALRRVNDPFPLHQRKQLFRNLGQRAIRGCHRAWRRGVRAVGGRPRRGVRRYRQRRRHRRAGRQQQRAAAAARQQHRQPQPLDRTAARRAAKAGSQGRAATCSARASAIVREDGPTLWRRARSDGSYASANDPRVLVGLGQSTSVPRVRVIWPSGTTEEWSAIAIDRYTTLREGDGK